MAECWMVSNGWDDGYLEADECRLLRERSVAGISNDIPECPVHGPHPGEERA